ncbi:MAG: choice-of-anchor Q domain-containing protein [Acidobacteriota bacterium]
MFRHPTDHRRSLSPRPLTALPLLGLLILGSLALTAQPAHAGSQEFFIDPLLGSPQGDGSAQNPWQTLEQVWADGLIEDYIWSSLPYEEGVSTLEIRREGAPIRGGATLWLRSGFHGALDIRGGYNLQPITVAAAPGHAPRLSFVELEAAQGWTLRGLRISKSFDPEAGTGGTLVDIDDHGFWGPSAEIAVEDCEIFSVADAGGWTAEQWIHEASTAVRVGSDGIQVRGNRIRNVRHGIRVTGQDALVSRNLIDGFSADGLLGNGDRGVFEYNRVLNSFVGSGQGDGNHDDAFQSFTVGPGGVGTGVIRDVVLRGNLIISATDPDHPLASTLQGIGCFDGNFENWTVENNVIITDHWHGITFHGMVDSKIVNNTVIDINETSPGPPWIRLTSSGQGESENVVVRNNLSTAFSLSGANITDDHNIRFSFSEAASHFVAPPYDLNLLASSAAVDAGSPDLAPPRDFTGSLRDEAPDIGAFEWCPGCLFADDFESGGTVAWTSF